VELVIGLLIELFEFISNRILEMAESNPDEIAFFIGVEIASALMENFTNRAFSILLYNLYFTDDSRTKMKSYSYLNHKIDYFNSFNRFLYFYPESVISTYFEEAELIRLSIKILNKADFKIFQSVEILRNFDEKLKFYPKHYRETNYMDKESSRYYTLANNYLKVYLI